jgi:voltage-gated sodium channel type XI alpha
MFFKRVLRIIKVASGVKKLLVTLLLSLPSLFNVGLLLLILLFIYAILGMNLFGKVKYGAAINDEANFSSFISSLILVFR